MTVSDSQARRKKIEKKYQATLDTRERAKVLLIQDDDVSHRLLVAWPVVQREIVLRGDLWGGLAFSYDEWCSLAGVPPSSLNFIKCDRLIKLELVFPDGRVHYWVQLFLDQKVKVRADS